MNSPSVHLAVTRFHKYIVFNISFIVRILAPSILVCWYTVISYIASTIVHCTITTQMPMFNTIDHDENIRLYHHYLIIMPFKTLYSIWREYSKSVAQERSIYDDKTKNVMTQFVIILVLLIHSLNIQENFVVIHPHWLNVRSKFQ